jgi:hypothetical protein
MAKEQVGGLVFRWSHAPAAVLRIPGAASCGY